MAETQKGASSSASSKEKSLLLDLDIGNDFLNSWKSMDDAMDFDFGPISMNKKKTFNFDKEDINFNLDSNFSKISSFKIDMSDLDISSPCKKTGKTKETSKDEPSGAKNKEKADGFTFNFDFKELDSFSFEPSPKRKEPTKNNLETEVSSETSAHQGSELQLSEDVGALDGGMPKKHSMPGMAITSTADSLVDSDLSSDPIGKDCSSKFTTNDNDASIPATVSHEAELIQTRIFPTSNTSSNTQGSDFQIEKGTSPQSVAQEAILDCSHQSTEHKSIHNVSPDVLEDGLVGAKLSSSDVEKDLELKAGLDSNNEKTVPESFPVQHSNASQESDQESGKSESDKHILISNIEGNNTHPECTHIASAKKDENFTKVNEDIQEPTSRLLKAPLTSGPAVQNLTQGKGDRGAIRSKFFVPSIETAAQKQKKSLTKTKLSAIGNKRIGTSPLSQADEGLAQNGKDDENGNKAGIPLPSSRSLPSSNTLQAGSQDSCKGLSNNMPSSISQKSKSMPHNRGNPRILESVVPSSTAKNTSIGGNKICPIKFGRKTLDISSLKLSKNAGASLCASQSLLKDGKSLGNLEQNTSLEGITHAKVNDSITKSTQKPNITPLKRKTTETTEEMVITSPFKRPSGLPSENRGFSGISERILDKQDCYSKDQENCNKMVEYRCSEASALDIPQAANKREFGALLTVEDDDNVDKAESYTKELDDICNMLRKKHEEAKELLVRSIVNNNKLLILNHPIYEEKIRVVKNFAAGLMKREIQTST